MSSRPRVLVVVPARGGSKRLPRKNILPMLGKPLIGWTIEAALKSGVADRVLVTSDDEEILKVASLYDVFPLKRSRELATDTATSVDVAIDAITKIEKAGEQFKTVILLQPTSPLRDADDIVAAYQAFLSGEGRSLVSVCSVDYPMEWCGSVDDNGELTGFDALSPRRTQEYKDAYRLNGAIYISDIGRLKSNNSFYGDKTLAFKMSREHSIDIDSKLDYLLCDVMLSRL